MKKIVKCSEADDFAYEKWMNDMRSTQGFKQVAALCSKNGYKLFMLDWDGKYLECNIRPVDKYCSEISLRRDRKSKSYYFVAQTTAYGSLTAEEYNVFRNAVEKTDALLTALNDLDFSSLDILHYDESESTI